MHKMLAECAHVMLTYQQHAIHHCAERSDGTMTSRSRGTWTSRRSTQCCRCADIVPTYCYLGGFAVGIWSILLPIC